MDTHTGLEDGEKANIGREVFELWWKGLVRREMFWIKRGNDEDLRVRSKDVSGRDVNASNQHFLRDSLPLLEQ